MMEGAPGDVTALAAAGWQAAFRIYLLGSMLADDAPLLLLLLLLTILAQLPLTADHWASGAPALTYSTAGPPPRGSASPQWIG